LKNLLAIIGIGAFAYWLFTSASNHITNNLSLVKATFSFGSISLGGIPVKVNLHVQNKTSIALPLDAFKGSITDGSNNLANVNVNHSTIVEPNQISIITVDSFLNFLQAGTAIVDRIKSGEYLRGLRIKGWMTVKGIDIPIDKDINPFTA
jgi:LEA14-like dessication related protein